MYMKKRMGGLARRALALLLTLTALLSLMVSGAAAAEVGEETTLTEGYALTVTPSATEAAPGDTITLTIEVYSGSEQVTDLSAAGLNLTTWLDYYADNGHEDGNSDATIASPNALTTEVTLPSAGTYYLVTELYDSAWTKLASATTTVTVAEATEPETPEPETPEVPSEGYALTVTSSATEAAPGDVITLTISVYSDGEPVTDLAAAGLNLTTWLDSWNDHADGNSDAVISDEHALTTEVTLPSAGTYYLVTELYDSAWTKLTSTTTTVTVSAPAVEAAINVEKVPGLSSDFIMGMDISSVLSEFASGVTYRDLDGNVIDNITDFCQFLKSCGVTHVRVRIWNDPFDSAGNGYGGGNNDVAAAAEIARGCAAAGLEMLLDFHCSDFWCDPGKQQAPKAWKDYTVDEKADALAAFLTDSLTTIQATGATIAMVQVGNETNSGFIGVSDRAEMCALFNAGSAAIRAFDPSIQVVIHVTNPEKSTMTSWAATLDANGVDYDVLATSYYPSWHGTLANLKSQLETVRTTYGKEVMVAETSYAFTLDDTDGHDNTIRSGNNDTMMCETQYPFSVQGQASYLRDIIAAVHGAGGIGVYYWESAWVTVGDTTGLSDDALTAQVDANKAIWEQYGSGWASSYAAEYDPTDAGTWYGGSAVDNQALFAADGSALASIEVWKLVQTGAVSNRVSVDSIAAPAETIEAGGTYALPETVTVTYSSGAVEEPVTWDEAEAAAVDANTPGTYEVHGTVTFSKTVDDGAYAGAASAEVVYTLTVQYPNLITNSDLAGFEDGSYFDTTGSGLKAIPSNEDVLEGSGTLHWYSASATSATVTTKDTFSLDAGSYTFQCIAMGYAGDTVTLNILDAEGNVLAEGTPAAMAGWTTDPAQCVAPAVSFTLTEAAEVKLSLTIGIQAGGWGSADALYLYQTAAAEEPEPEPVYADAVLNVCVNDAVTVLSKNGPEGESATFTAAEIEAAALALVPEGYALTADYADVTVAYGGEETVSFTATEVEPEPDPDPDTPVKPQIPILGAVIHWIASVIKKLFWWL